MSAVSGPTPMNAENNAPNPDPLKSSSKSNSTMTSSSVVTETRINGSSQPTTSPAPAPAEAPPEASLSISDSRNNSNPSVNSQVREEQPRATTSQSDAPPLPANLKRILAEVARTGACSWLTWNSSGDGQGKDKDGQAASLSASSSTTDAATAALAPATNQKSPASSKYALGLPSIPSNRGQNRRPYSATNRFPAAGATPPKSTRKKHRNGVKVRSTRRLGEGATGSKTQTTGGGSRKRPLYLIRTSASNAAAAGAVFSPGSVGSGRTSGSEPDDSTQYECDSEGTSATSCSELSTERRDHHLRNMQLFPLAASKRPPAATTDEVQSSQDDYHCLKDVFRMALGHVLDHWYRNRGGYKLSPAEKRRSETLKAEKSSSTVASALVNGEHKANHLKNPLATFDPRKQQSQQQQQVYPQDKKSNDITAENVFQQRRQRLLMMLGQSGTKSTGRRNPTSARVHPAEGDEGPPFTIQRIAEVLIAPERYYTQTHKLCNCLEKLLLVTSSTSAFGGSTGGITSQSRLEERELAALASEKGRLESEFRQRALKRRCSSLSDDIPMEGGADAHSRTPGSPSRDEGSNADVKSNDSSPETKADNDSESSSREMLEAAARSLRTKFDHVGIDPHNSAVGNRDVRSIAENRGMTNSPPPPSLAMSAAAASNIALPGHSAVGNFVRQHLPEQNAEHPSIARVPSPILFSQSNESAPMAPLHAAPLLHMHHAAPLAGVSVGSTPFDVVTIDAGRTSAPTSTNLPGSNEGADLEGRSSASNSDVDSESDDVSFDDSASDRSDGSDSGHYEPFTAARAMALNRIQQQQRLQSRGGVLTSLALHQNEGGFRPPADSEYQSGDSIDSTRGEDSGGSDSSSSDLAD